MPGYGILTSRFRNSSSSSVSSSQTVCCQKVFIQERSDVTVPLTPPGGGVFLFFLLKLKQHAYVNTDAIVVGKFFHWTQSSSVLLKNGAQAEPNLAAVAVLWYFQIQNLLLQFLLHGALPDGGQTLAAVHHRLCKLAAQADYAVARAIPETSWPPRTGKGGDAGADQLKGSSSEVET